MELVIDFETRSCIDLKKCGMYEYWRSPFTEIMMLSVKEDLNPARMWIPPKFRALFPTEISDDEFEHKMGESEKVIAHNAGFERQGFKYGMTKLGFSDLPLEKVYCTMAQALHCALPRDLDSVAKIASGGKFLKDKEGHNLMLKMSKPRGFVKKDCEALLPIFTSEERCICSTDITWKDIKSLQAEFVKNAATGNVDPQFSDIFLVYKEDQESFVRLVEYARQDTEVERMVYDRLPKIPEAEIEVWRMDQRINDRGVRIDRESCSQIKASVNEYTDILVKKALEITNNEVTSMKSPSSILSWLRTKGIDTDSVDKEAVSFLLSLELPEDVREFLEIRQKTGRSAVAKYEAFLNYTNSDGRLRGFATYHVATTGRWGGNGPQVHNLPRPSEKNFVKLGVNDDRREVHADELDIPLLVSRDYPLIDMFWQDTMVLASDLIRPMLMAQEGCEFVCSDFSAVEARGLAWLAGQEDILDAFRGGLDIYKTAASGIFKIPYGQVDGGGKGAQRQIGKTAILACFAPETEVLTNLGWVKIVDITKNHKLWDGLSWVNHEGVIFSGLRKTVNLDGIRVTPDHLMFDGISWKTAISCVKNQQCMQSVRSYGESAYLTSILNNVLQDVKKFCTKFNASIVGMKRGANTAQYVRLTTNSAINVNTQVTRLKKRGLRENTLNFLRARRLGNSQLSAQRYVQEKVTHAEKIIVSLCSAIAELPRTGYLKGTYEMDALQDALNALMNSLGELLVTLKKMASCHFQKIKNSAGNSITLLKHRNKDVKTLTAECTLITGVAELNLDLARLEKQLHGIFRSLTAVKKDILSTELTITDITKKGMSGSQREENRQKINGQSENLSKKSSVYEPVYDIMNVGKNNRFLVRGDSGFFMAHNCGYGGGYGAMLRFGADKLGIDENEGKEIVRAWRKANDKIVKFWYALRDGSMEAMKFPGDRIKVGKVSFRKRGSFLTLRLPSGRDLFYPGAKVEMCDMPWVDEQTGEVAQQKLVTAMTLTAAKQWVRRPLSHVTLSENVTQATCRDLLANAMFNVEKAGYPIVAHIHDEILSEVPTGHGSVEEFERLMAELPSWADGFPLVAAGGYRSKRYRK